MEKPVLCEIENHVALITLNRPERRNAINRELLFHLYNYLDEVSAVDDVRVIILTGNGKSFCSGVDLSVIGSENLFDLREDGRDFPDIIGACPKVVIGAINGHAITGGFEIALNCDFLIASENASFADTHAKVGIHPGWGMTQLLQQAVGRRRAMQMSSTCQFISAQEALQYGLVNEIVSPESLIPRAKAIAAQMLETQPKMLQLMKRFIKARDERTHTEAYNHERKGFKAFVDQHLNKA